MIGNLGDRHLSLNLEELDYLTLPLRG
jgi:hypothetical protein